MSETEGQPTRWIGLDIHKHYLVAIGVNKEQEQIFGPYRVPYPQLEKWVKKHLKPTDAVVLEMTTNTWTMYDLLLPYVHSATVVHPPDVSLIVKARVMTDKKAALVLAQLHAAGLLPAVWVPPQDVRDLRALIAQRRKVVSLITQAKNRLHAVLHRYHILPPEGDLFAAEQRSWWEGLSVSALELVRIQCDLDTLAHAQRQKERLEDCLAVQAAQDERVPLLVQLPGIGYILALTILGAIGEIGRFPTAKKLVGYAGLEASVHASGQSYTTGHITKSGRRDLRAAMVEAAHHATGTHPHWKAQFERLEGRLGRSKAIVAIARKLLVAVWHILTKEVADRHAEPQQVACSFFAHAYKIGVRRLPGGLSAKAFTRQQLDRLGIGQALTQIPWGTRIVKLPPSLLDSEISSLTEGATITPG